VRQRQIEYNSFPCFPRISSWTFRRATPYHGGNIPTSSNLNYASQPIPRSYLHKHKHLLCPVILQSCRAGIAYHLVIPYFRSLMSPIYAPPAFEKSVRHKFACNNSVEINLLVVLVCEYDGRGMACTLGVQILGFFICHNLLDLQSPSSTQLLWLHNQISNRLPFPHVFRLESIAIRCLDTNFFPCFTHRRVHDVALFDDLASFRL
jgi:hypothetical protein